MSISINGTNGLTFNDASVQNTAATGFGFKNRILNGSMMIDQRNAGASVTPSTGSQAYTLDRWLINYTQTSKFTVQQNAGSVALPAGFSKYLGATSTSAYSSLAADQFYLGQQIEGFNFSDFGWGTSNAQPATMSFRVYSSLTGTFSGAVLNSAANRSYVFTYSVPVANTWTTISVTIAGDTTGTWIADNGIGMRLLFDLGSGSTYQGSAGAWSGSLLLKATGSVSVVGTNGATFYITGVQLEKGSTATSFDYRPYGTELALCQRYFEKSYNTDVVPGTSSASGRVQFTAGSDQNGNQIVYTTFKVTKRGTPTLTFYTYQGTAGQWNYDRNGASGSGTENVYNEGFNGFSCYISVGSGYVVCEAYGHWVASSEL